MNPLWMVLADLRKTFLSSLGVLVLLVLAFSATVAVSLFERSLREAGAFSAQDFDLVVGAPGSRLDLVLAAVFLRTDEVLPLLDANVLAGVEADPRVATVSPLVFSDHYAGFPVVGIGGSFSALRPSLKLEAGRWPSADFEVAAGSSTGLDVGAHFAGNHGVHDTEGVEEATHATGYTVVGRLARSGTPWDRGLLTPYQGIWALHEAEGETENQGVSALLVKPKDFASAYGLRAQYREGVTTAAFPGEVLAGLFGLFDEAKTVLALVSTLFQALVLAAVVLSLLAGLPSKARWIGLLRALGAGRLYVFLTLWLQTVLVLTVAGLSGGLVGLLGAQALAAYTTELTGLTLTVAWSGAETLVLALYGLAGLVGALVPAVVGYRTSVRRSLLGA